MTDAGVVVDADLPLVRDTVGRERAAKRSIGGGAFAVEVAVEVGPEHPVVPAIAADGGRGRRRAERDVDVRRPPRCRPRSPPWRA